jgi:multidrug efflux pump subunit AcrA (membrane-fusion protein)
MIQYRCLNARGMLFVGVALSLCLGGCGSSGSPSPTAPAASLVVTGVAPLSRELDQSIAVSGSVSAWQEMSLGVELTGIRATDVLVEVGDRVRAGQALLRLDSRTLDVQFRQAEAGVTQAQAALELAKANAARGESLVEQGLISSSDSDKLRADLRSAEAQLITALADRDAAGLRLGFATLSAPDDGIISVRAVQPGQEVSAGGELLRLIRVACRSRRGRSHSRETRCRRGTGGTGWQPDQGPGARCLASRRSGHTHRPPVRRSARARTLARWHVCRGPDTARQSPGPRGAAGICRVP